jgi:hypothetical protein
MPGGTYCLFHSQQAEAKRIMADARRAGGLARLASLKPTGLVVRVGTPQECKETARQALQLMLDGKLDRQAYYRALRELRAPLSELLTQRAEQWVQQWQNNSKYFDLYRAAKNWVTDTAGHIALSERYAEGSHASVAKAKGWALALQAGTALRCAAAELVEVQSLTVKPVESLL